MDAEKPFFLYFNHSLMHLPTIARAEFKAKPATENGPTRCWNSTPISAHSSPISRNSGSPKTRSLFSQATMAPKKWSPGEATEDRGRLLLHRHGGFAADACDRALPWPCSSGEVSNEIVHITDMFTTLVRWVGLDIPKDRVIDGVDQRAFFEGKQKTSGRNGFLYWMGDTLYGVKWRDFKMVLVLQQTLADPALRLATPHLVNLDTDPKELKAYDFPYIHSWVIAHTATLLREYQQSIRHENLIPVGAPLDYVPKESAK